MKFMRWREPTIRPISFVYILPRLGLDLARRPNSKNAFDSSVFTRIAREACMPIETNFKFGQSVAPPAAAARTVQDPRGLLAGFVGDLPLAAPGQDNPKRRWQGQGFNLIWRPNFGNQSGTKDFSSN